MLVLPVITEPIGVSPASSPTLSAAEHAARTIAMQEASDNAQKLLQELKLQYNKQRQQAITDELLDIVSGTMVNN